MNARLLSVATGLMLSVLTGCQESSPVDPLTLAKKVAGDYQTNAYADPICVAVPSDKMARTSVRAIGDSSITVVFRRFYPADQSFTLSPIRLTRQGEAIQLWQDKRLVGTWQNDRIFTDNGRETQANVLRLVNLKASADSVSFIGYR